MLAINISKLSQVNTKVIYTLVVAHLLENTWKSGGRQSREHFEVDREDLGERETHAGKFPWIDIRTTAA